MDLSEASKGKKCFKKIIQKLIIPKRSIKKGRLRIHNFFEQIKDFEDPRTSEEKPAAAVLSRLETGNQINDKIFTHQIYKK